MPNKKLNHIHTIELKYGIKNSTPFSGRMFRCRDPLCYFRETAGSLLGKKFKCPTCENEYIADRNVLMKKLPHCLNCTKVNAHYSKNSKFKVQAAVELKTIEERLKEILGTQ